MRRGRQGGHVQGAKRSHDRAVGRPQGLPPEPVRGRAGREYPPPPVPAGSFSERARLSPCLLQIEERLRLLESFVRDYVVRGRLSYYIKKPILDETSAKIELLRKAVARQLR